MKPQSLLNNSILVTNSNATNLLQELSSSVSPQLIVLNEDHSVFYCKSH